ncbi:MAG: hypothetical protein QM733_20685 [Ilumatobacteraceae bacterium]
MGLADAQEGRKGVTVDAGDGVVVDIEPLEDGLVEMAAVEVAHPLVKLAEVVE